MRFTNFLKEVTNPDFDVSVDFGDGTFKPAGSFHSEQAAKREGRLLCTLDGNGKKYKVTNNVTGKSKTYSAASKELSESEANYVAMSAYRANLNKVLDQVEALKLNIAKHRDRYMATDRTDWGYSGDLERVKQHLSEINDSLKK